MMQGVGKLSPVHSHLPPSPEFPRRCSGPCGQTRNGSNKLNIECPCGSSLHLRQRRVGAWACALNGWVNVDILHLKGGTAKLTW